MTVELLVAIAGGFLSLALAYVPKVKEWYEPKTPEQKAQIMAALLIAATLGVFGLACANLLVLFGLEVACTAASAVQLLQLLLVALAANQAVFSIAVRPFKS